MASPVQLTIGSVDLERVEYFDVGLDAEGLRIPPEVVEATDWARPAWADDEGQVLIGQAMWVLRSGGTTIVVDPCGASDAFLRTGPEAITHQEAMLAALVAAGVDPDDVDVVLMSHLDGIGLVAVVDDQGRWSPAFPNARVVINAVELARIVADPSDAIDVTAFRALVEQGVVDGVVDGYEVAPQVVLEQTDGHGPGHSIIRVGAGDDRAVLVGHLAVSPLHTVVGACDGLNLDPPAAWKALSALVAEAADTGEVLIGPLWPAPGAARAERRGESIALVPLGG